MRILLLSQYYAPEPVPKPGELAAALVARGHSVSVITGFPNYPSGNIYSGYRLRPMSRETRGDVEIIHTFVYPYHGGSAIRRCLNYGTFMVSSIVGALFAPRCDVIYVWHPPLTMGISAWIIGWLKRAGFVYDVQDIWPESLTVAGKVTNPIIVWLLHGLERFVYRRARHILVVTDGAKDNLIGKGVRPDKIAIASPWVNKDLFEPCLPTETAAFRTRHKIDNRFVVMYAGNMGILQGLDTIVDCADLLLAREEIVFVFVGDGVERLSIREAVEVRRLTNVVFVDRQSLTDMPTVLASADLLLVHLKRSPLSDFVIPGKVMGYLAAAKPIVMASEGPAAELVRAAAAGLTVPPEAPKLMAEAVISLFQLSKAELDALGRNGRRYIAEFYSMQPVLDRYERLLEKSIDVPPLSTI